MSDREWSASDGKAGRALAAVALVWLSGGDAIAIVRAIGLYGDVKQAREG